MADLPDPLIVACPACSAANRVPRARLGGGRCGKCGSRLFAGEPVALTAANFDRHAATSDVPLLVDFWASWCGPCRRSFPWMNDMQQKYGSKGFVVVGINVDKKRADADKFLAQNPASFAIAFDEAGTTPSAYAVKGMPSSYLVDGKGNVVYVERGFLDEHKAGLEQRIATLVAKN